MQSPSWLAPSEVLPMASSVCTRLPPSARSSTMSPFIQKAVCQCLRGDFLGQNPGVSIQLKLPSKAECPPKGGAFLRDPDASFCTAHSPFASSSTFGAQVHSPLQALPAHGHASVLTSRVFHDSCLSCPLPGARVTPCYDPFSTTPEFTPLR
ncbi:unnamed protein product [Rangifer tarandus platyrhynchus]|uniref:Uncharacterized protein n=1 Tax=Rangifer tarandus platyrhynchus TaxID=3082113 RepID=A0AC59ZS74_RANTA